MTILNLKPESRLAGIFNQTDNIAWGPFKVKKPVGAAWPEAKVTVDGVELKLASQQKLIMALLISQPSEVMKASHIAETTETKGSGLKVHIHHIKQAILAIPECAHHAGLIIASSSHRHKGDRATRKQTISHGYKLQDPSNQDECRSFIYSSKPTNSRFDLTPSRILVVRDGQGFRSFNYTATSVIPQAFSAKAATHITRDLNATLMWKGPVKDIVYFGENKPELVSLAMKRFSSAPLLNNH